MAQDYDGYPVADLEKINLQKRVIELEKVVEAVCKELEDSLPTVRSLAELERKTRVHKTALAVLNK